MIAEKVATLELLNECLWAWLEGVYHVRVHSETGQAPIDLYRSQISEIRQADPIRVQRAFLWRFIRKVTGNGFISLLGNQYSVDPQWSGRHLEIRLDPYDLSQVFVYEKKQPIGKATIKLQKKQRMLEIERTLPPPPDADLGISFLSLLREEYRQQRHREIESINFRKVEAEQ